MDAPSLMTRVDRRDSFVHSDLIAAIQGMMLNWPQTLDASSQAGDLAEASEETFAAR